MSVAAHDAPTRRRFVINSDVLFAPIDWRCQGGRPVIANAWKHVGWRNIWIGENLRYQCPGCRELVSRVSRMIVDIRNARKPASGGVRIIGVSRGVFTRAAVISYTQLREVALLLGRRRNIGKVCRYAQLSVPSL